MKEYWVNVYAGGYRDPIYGFEYSTRDNAEDAAFHVFQKCLYRIHVKLKDTVIDGNNQMRNYYHAPT